MSSRALVLAALSLLLVPGCDGEESTGDGGTPPPSDSGPPVPPPGPLPPSDCDTVELVDVSGATEVANEDELRAALATGGSILVTADITATAPFDVTVPTVVDGGGNVISGGGTTHLFVSVRTDFTIQNVTLRDANNQVPDSEHFSRRSGAAIMASGGSASDGTRMGSLTVIDVVFENNTIKAAGPGDLRGGAVHVFALPDTTIAGSTFTNNEGSNGGAIGGLGSSLRIIGTRFDGNRTSGTGTGPGEGHGGAISLDAVSQNGVTAYFEVCGCDFRNNESFNTGGAFSLVTHWYTGTRVTFDQTSFVNNRTTSGEEGQGGALFLMDDEKSEIAPNPAMANSAAITNCLFDRNETWSRGAGIWYWTMDGRLTLQNTTFVDNRVTRTDTGMGGGLAVSRGPTDIIHCTFARNFAMFHGGGIQMGGDAVVSMLNTLFFDNASDREGGWANFQTNRPVDTDLGGNLQHLDDAMVIDSNSDELVSADAMRIEDPRLLEIADNGGPTMTMMLGDGSPAIDSGTADGAPTTDQRGMPRDDTPDVGALEVQP